MAGKELALALIDEPEEKTDGLKQEVGEQRHAKLKILFARSVARLLRKQK